MSTQFERFQALQSALANSFVAGTLPDPTPELLASFVGGVQLGVDGLPTGVTIVDVVNGLLSVDPSLGNPDTAGQTFCAEAALGLFEPGSQADFTIRQNNADALSAEGPGHFGMHPRVRPMVATGDSRKFEYAPVIIGETMDRVPWIPGAWTITGGDWNAFLDHVLHRWHLNTNSGADPHGHVAGG